MLNCTNYTRKSLSTFTISKFIVQHTAVILFCKHMCGNYIIDIGFVHSNVELNICLTAHNYMKQSLPTFTRSKFIAQHTIVMSSSQSPQMYKLYSSIIINKCVAKMSLYLLVYPRGNIVSK